MSIALVYYEPSESELISAAANSFGVNITFYKLSLTVQIEKGYGTKGELCQSVSCVNTDNLQTCD